MNDQIIIIQKVVRGYLSRKKLLIPSSLYQTKNWRKIQKWYINGKKNECEKYQKKMTEKILKKNIEKTHERINYKTNEIHIKKYPLKDPDGFDWSENFDGYLKINEKIYYFNFKFVCDNGGAQTRTLRELYFFIKNQFLFLEKKNLENIYFINILDGSACYKHSNQFLYLKNHYKSFENRFFIGDLYQFQNQYKNFF